MKTIITGGTIVNEGTVGKADVVISNDRIARIVEPGSVRHESFDHTIDATGCFVLPGVIDDHVHFRDPGLTRKADMVSETRAAAYGGVTSFLEMPNTIPQTTTVEALKEKWNLAKEKCSVNYAFFFGATNDNASVFGRVDRHRIPGIKLFMGSSTGNMLVDKQAALERVFATAAELDLPLMTHCEDTQVINANMNVAKAECEDPPISMHPHIRSAEACYDSTKLAVQLARRFGTRLHVAHVSTARELEFFGMDSRITGEAVIAHLLFCEADYATKGARIKCNPAVKTADDRAALRRALIDGRIAVVGTDHAPHLLAEKEGGCRKAASGMPMIQFSLVAMLQLVDEGVLPIERVVELMCHRPARLFEVSERGFLRPGYKADVAVVRPGVEWTVTADCVQSKCGWSPLEGLRFHWQVEKTLCNGHLLYDNGKFDEQFKGEALRFRS